MYSYKISTISRYNKSALKEVDMLLEEAGIRRDDNLDYTCGVYDNNGELIATGSYFHNTLRCLAVSPKHKGEGLMNTVVTHLVNQLHQKGHHHLFMYTKIDSSKLFSQLGFYEIAQVDGELSFMENRRNGFSNYLKSLDKANLPKEANISSIVMNANPFTNGHKYLVEQASKVSDWVYLFVLEEDASLFPYDVRLKLVQEGTAHLDNVSIQKTGNYIISQATFPSYFQSDQVAVIDSHALLDGIIFTKIADYLGIKKRFVGEEPYSKMTKRYNLMLEEAFAGSDIELEVIPRLEAEDGFVSASKVRQALANDDFELVRSYVPDSTYNFLVSDDAKDIIENIKASDQIIHH